MHPAATDEQSCPCLALHVPEASHVPVHRPVGSSWLSAATQECVVSQRWQAPPLQSALVQQALPAMQVVVFPTVQARDGEGQA